MSLGTGLPSLKDVGTSVALFNTIKDIVTDTEQVAEEVQKEIDHLCGTDHIYFRFNVQRGLEGVKLEEWKEMGRIKTVTDSYLLRERQTVNECASQLIKNARM